MKSAPATRAACILVESKNKEILRQAWANLSRTVTSLLTTESNRQQCERKANGKSAERQFLLTNKCWLASAMHITSSLTTKQFMVQKYWHTYAGQLNRTCCALDQSNCWQLAQATRGSPLNFKYEIPTPLIAALHQELFPDHYRCHKWRSRSLFVKMQAKLSRLDNWQTSNRISHH